MEAVNTSLPASLFPFSLLKTLAHLVAAVGVLLLPDLPGQDTPGDEVCTGPALLSNWVIYYSRVLASAV